MAKRHTTSAQFRAQVPLESLHGESQIIDRPSLMTYNEI
jgi:hypothetical protein